MNPVRVPEQAKTGAVKEFLEIADDGEDDWRQGVAEIWGATGAIRRRHLHIERRRAHTGIATARS